MARFRICAGGLGNVRNQSGLVYMARMRLPGMAEVKEYTFDELCRVVGDIAAEYGMIRVYLFGSRARGDNRPDSDYDFCVVAPEGMGLFRMGGFYGKLEEALGAEVDIVSERAISGDFSREVLRDRKLVYEAPSRESRYGRAMGNSPYRVYRLSSFPTIA